MNKHYYTIRRNGQPDVHYRNAQDVVTELIFSDFEPVKVYYYGYIVAQFHTGNLLIKSACPKTIKTALEKKARDYIKTRGRGVCYRLIGQPDLSGDLLIQQGFVREPISHSVVYQSRRKGPQWEVYETVYDVGLQLRRPGASGTGSDIERYRYTPPYVELR